MKRFLDKAIHRFHKRRGIGGRVKVGTTVIRCRKLKAFDQKRVVVHEIYWPMRRSREMVVHRGAAFVCARMMHGKEVS